MCLASKKLNQKWILDSGCSWHMTGDENQFISLEVKEGGIVTFGDNAKGKIIRIGKVHISSSSYIENVLLVEGLKHNLLSINQLCDKNFNVSFKSSICCVACPITNNFIFSGHRNGNVYVVDLDNININKQQYLVANNANSDESSWLWHRSLAHANMDLISKLSRKYLVRGLPKLKYENNQICKASQLGK